MRTGFRSVRIVDGHLQLNWKAVNLRGSGVHEMDVRNGSALSDEGRTSCCGRRASSAAS